RLKTTLGIVVLRPSAADPPRSNATTPVRPRLPTSGKNATVRCQCGQVSSAARLRPRRTPNSPYHQKATTPTRQSGCKTRRERGYSAKTLRCLLGEKYDAK